MIRQSDGYGVFSLRIALYLTAGSLPAAAGSVTIPRDTVLEVRQNHAVGSKVSKAGDTIEATVIAPVMAGGRTLVPAGSKVSGRVARAHKLGLGVRRQTALLEVEFHRLTLPDGSALPLKARLVEIQTAREAVLESGQVRGIRPTANLSSNLATVAWRLTMIEPQVAIPVWFIKGLVAPVPDPEVHLPAGTELRLRLTGPLEVEPASPAPSPLLAEEHQRALREIVKALPSQRIYRESGVAADPINVALAGTGEEILKAFQAAGWTVANRTSTGSVLRAYFSLVKRKGYSTAPMGAMRFDGRLPSLELQKNLNSMVKRHHIRLWMRPETVAGKQVWVGAATEDIGVVVSRGRGIFTHLIDEEIDTERAKVIHDLLYTGCVEAAGLVDRDGLDLEPGPAAVTDGAIAATVLGACPAPRPMPAAYERHQDRRPRLIRAVSSVRRELARSNILNLGFNGALLTATVHRLRLTRPQRTPSSGAPLNAQQVEWLREAR